MNWPFRSNRTFSTNEGCESIEPLLSLYADAMASPDEARRVESHLPGCESCRESLAWMQATRRALAGRPIAVPPANLHSRIAEAIAASAGPSLLRSPALRPARSFTMRSRYAAAASVTALGLVLSYSLLHSSSDVAVRPTPAHGSNIASAPAAKVPAPIAPRPIQIKPARPLVAQTERTSDAERSKPAAVRRLPILVKPAPVINSVPQERIATTLPVSAGPSALTRVKPTSHAVMQHDKVASVKVTPSIKHLPLVPEKAAPLKTSGAPLIASRIKEPIRIPLSLPLPTLTVDTPPVKTASAQTAPKSDNILASIVPSIKIQNAVQAAPRFAAREAGRGVTSIANVINRDEHYGSLDAIHSPTSLH